MRKLLIVALCSGLMLSACSKKRLTTRKIPKNPPSLPMHDPKLTREPVAGFVVTDSFGTALESKGIDLSKICLQLAEFKKDSESLGMYLEISAVGCPGSGLVEEDGVLRRIKAVQDTQFNTNWRLILEESYSPEVGTVHRFNDNGTVQMKLEGLCDIDTMNVSRGWHDYCDIAVEGDKFRSPEPLNLYNLD